MTKDLIEWKTIIIGIVVVIALYAISYFSGQNMVLTDFLVAGIAVGFMVGGDIKDGAINGVIFGVIGAIIVALILVAIYSIAGYGAYLGLLASSMLTYLILEIVVALAGGILGSLIRAESEKTKSPT